MPYDPVTPHLGKCSEDFKAVPQRNTCTPMLIQELMVVPEAREIGEFKAIV